jgi:acylphosphatase
VTGFEDTDAGSGGERSGQVADSLSRQARLTAWVRGRVQGVGFRWWVRSIGLELGLLGVAENLVDGRVKIVVEGNRDSCMALLERLAAPGAPGHVVQVTHRWDQARGGLAGFVERLPDLGLRPGTMPVTWVDANLTGWGSGWDHEGVTCAQLARFLRFCVRDHSGHSVWRTSSNGEGSAWPCWRAGSPHGF